MIDFIIKYPILRYLIIILLLSILVRLGHNLTYPINDVYQYKPIDTTVFIDTNNTE